MTKLAPEPRTCPLITRVDIAWTCVAASDPHPLHIDHEFARKAGFPDAVAPGSMVAGWIGEYLSDWAGGVENVLDYRLRLCAPLYPGQQVALAGKLLDGEGEGCRCEISATNQEGAVVALAWAHIR